MGDIRARVTSRHALLKRISPRRAIFLIVNNNLTSCYSCRMLPQKKGLEVTFEYTQKWNEVLLSISFSWVYAAMLSLIHICFIETIYSFTRKLKEHPELSHIFYISGGHQENSHHLHGLRNNIEVFRVTP